MQPKLDAQGVFDAVNEHLQSIRTDLTEPLRVREEALAEKLGVSRTPVREALIRLESVGMISLRPGRGALLMPVTDAEYLEWLQIRELLEGLASREAALNASQRDVDNLLAIFAPFIDRAPQDASDLDYAKANVAFHKEIMRLCGNSLLIRVWASFGHLQTSFRRQTISRLHRQDESLAEHLALIEAIRNRDADLAESLAQAHVRALAHAVNQALKTSVHQK